MEVLLLLLYAHIWFYPEGCLPNYIAQIFNSYASIRLYVALSDSPLQSLLFQTVGDAESFTLKEFEFDLLDYQVESDIVVYDLTFGEFKFRLYVCTVLIPSNGAGQNKTWISYTSCGTIRKTS
jgi:hypothetical protein